MENQPIYVTKTHLPDRNKFDTYVDQIFQSSRLTNNGPLVQQLTEELEAYLQVKNLLLVANGTLALQIAYRVLQVTGSAVTSPFSFAATTSSLVWEHIQPQFADIDPHTFCLDPQKIEEAVTEKTSAVVPVHVFGNACDIEAIDAAARKNNLKVIYDAAHAFGVNYKGKSLLNYGDASILSFHATKLFHTIEGGAIVFKQKEDLERAKRMINFGIEGPVSIASIGINAKMNEFQAAMGLCVLDEMDSVKEGRKQAWNRYYEELKNLVPDKLQLQKWTADNQNFGYFPMVFKSEEKLLKVQDALNKEEIFPRRYFYPSLNTVDAYVKEIDGKKQKMPVSEDISKRILCLPMYENIDDVSQEIIISIIHQDDFSKQ